MTSAAAPILVSAPTWPRSPRCSVPSCHSVGSARRDGSLRGHGSPIWGRGGSASSCSTPVVRRLGGCANSGPSPRRVWCVSSAPRTTVEADVDRGRFVAGSSHPDEVVGTALVDARIATASVSRTADPLLRALHDRTRCARKWSATATGRSTRARSRSPASTSGWPVPTAAHIHVVTHSGPSPVDRQPVRSRVRTRTQRRSARTTPSPVRSCGDCRCSPTSAVDRPAPTTPASEIDDERRRRPRARQCRVARTGRSTMQHSPRATTRPADIDPMCRCSTPRATTTPQPGRRSPGSQRRQRDRRPVPGSCRSRCRPRGPPCSTATDSRWCWITRWHEVIAPELPAVDAATGATVSLRRRRRQRRGDDGSGGSHRARSVPAHDRPGRIRGRVPRRHPGGHGGPADAAAWPLRDQRGVHPPRCTPSGLWVGGHAGGGRRGPGPGRRGVPARHRPQRLGSGGVRTARLHPPAAGPLRRGPSTEAH